MFVISNTKCSIMKPFNRSYPFSVNPVYSFDLAFKSEMIPFKHTCLFLLPFPCLFFKQKSQLS